MKAMRRVRQWPGCIAVCIALARSVSGEPVANEVEALEPISIRVQGPPGCPSGEDFWQSLQRRAPGTRLARRGEPGRVFEVRFERTESGTASGRIRILDVDGRALEREIDGNSCVEVSEALAFIASLGARGALPIEDQAGAPARERPVRPRPPPSKEIHEEHHDVIARDEDRTSEWILFVRAEGSVRTQIVPAALYGAGAAVELSRNGSSPWQPAFGLLVDATLTGTASTANIAPNTEMSGQLIALHVLASPLRLRAGPIEARPFASVDFGRLFVQGRGNGLESAGETRMFWFAAALFAQMDLRLGPHWAVGAKAGAEVHPLLVQFEFTPRDVYRVGVVGLVAGVSLSFRLN
jgi:hypothetical protein